MDHTDHTLVGSTELQSFMARKFKGANLEDARDLMQDSAPEPTPPLKNTARKSLISSRRGAPRISTNNTVAALEVHRARELLVGSAPELTPPPHAWRTQQDQADNPHRAENPHAGGLSTRAHPPHHAQRQRRSYRPSPAPLSTKSHPPLEAWRTQDPPPLQAWPAPVETPQQHQAEHQAESPEETQARVNRQQRYRQRPSKSRA